THMAHVGVALLGVGEVSYQGRIVSAAEALAAEGTDVPPPATLHRLLGFAPRRGLGGGQFRHHANNPLPQLAVVVDEASMVDLALLDQLLRALRPDARLVLVGDAGQLPAIAAGSVFRDLAAAGDAALAGSVVRLSESHRMSPADAAGAQILAVARGIAAGEAPAAAPVSDPAALRFAGFEHLDPGDGVGARRALGAFIDRWYATQLRVGTDAGESGPGDPRLPLQGIGGALDATSAARAHALLERHRRARLLTVTRVGRAGADRVNEELARRAAADLGASPGGAETLPAGTPVIVVENDYDRGLMNGDQGIVLPVAHDGATAVATAVFPRAGTLALFPLATLRGLVQVAYAITVHKAQGSEVDRAALLLPDADMPLLSRELIYTAATRARASMVVVGRTALLAQAVARPLGRTSGLAERLAARRPSPGR
ncbi:MAG TPA: AAA family ATPase, partial [Polyangia bacterium]|nr:AAA family ATPase [Polyangia bacterium]